MQLIKPSYEIIEQAPDRVGILKHIEISKRVCYKSEHNITDNSYEEAVKDLINRKHGAMLEHGTIYLSCKITKPDYLDTVYLGNWFADFYSRNKYSKIFYIDNILYVTTNYRVLVENNRLEDLKYYLTEPTDFHEKRYTVRFTCDRGVSHEFVRNRGEDGNGFAQESTRFCNYLKEKFGMSVSYAEPVWLKEEEREEFEQDLKVNEATYFKWLDKGWIPQQARGFLNHFLKTELIITATSSDWAHFFSLRDDKAAHPSARELATPLHAEFIKRGYLKTN